MSTSLVSKYKKLVLQHLEIQNEESRAKTRYEAVVAERKKIEREMADLESALEYGEQLMSTAPKGSHSPPIPAQDGDGPPNSIREVVLLIPRDGEITRADLLSALGLNTGALNSRLMDSKNRGYIEGVPGKRGHYRLTDKGKAVHGHGLQVVSGGN